jgi:hypothetical protein
MSKIIKILSLSNQFEAMLLDELLNEKEIPHIVKSYRDSALDGLWQTQSIWGHIEAPEEFKDEITGLYSNMSEESEQKFFNY